MDFSVAEGAAAIKWLEDVRRAADAHTHELGFFPRNVFASFANRGMLNVLVWRDSAGESHYAGHLLFDARYPRAHIRQMFVVRTFRQRGAASFLLKRLIASLSAAGFIAIYARVGEDLVEANSFWDRHEFVVFRIDAGGASKKRRVLVRCRELDAPQLFPPSKIDAKDPLGLAAGVGVELPLFLLDLNVLFDVTKPRRPRREQVVGLLQAERMNFCRLAISDEIRNELRRTSLCGRETDPMAGFIEIFPEFPLSPSGHGVSVDRLAKIVFPQGAMRRLNPNEVSDLRHLACVINNGLAGLITNDGALLDAAVPVRRSFGVEVIPSGYFEGSSYEEIGQRSFDATDESKLDLKFIQESHVCSIRSLLSEKVGVTSSEIVTKWIPHGALSRIATGKAVWDGDVCVGFITRTKKPSVGNFGARAAVDPSHPLALSIARILLLDLVDGLAGQGACQLRLEFPARQASLREVAAGLGFVGVPGSGVLVKSILGRVVTRASWAECCAVLENAGGAKLLTQDIPNYCEQGQLLLVQTADGNRAHVSLEQLESLLCPALFCLPKRPAVLVPIERRFSEPLLQHTRQLPLLSEGTASLFRERLYLSSPRTFPRFKRGMLMFFYESGKNQGSQQVVAVARVREVFLKPAASLNRESLMQSVLTQRHVKEIGKSEMKTVTLFDNIFRLECPVGLDVLSRLGCGRPNDLITAKLLTDEQAAAIIASGFDA